MSGGEMDYLCYKMEEVSEKIEDKEIKHLMIDLANLMHDLEWYLSGDYSIETYHKTLKAFKTKWFYENRNDRLKEYINERLDEMKSEMERLI